MYKLKRRLERREKARREAANLQMSGSGSSHGGSFDTMSSANESVAGNSQSSTNYHSDVTNYTPRSKLPRGIVEVVTLMDSSDDSEEEEVRILRKKRREHD